jgi:hypothetical protein
MTILSDCARAVELKVQSALGEAFPGIAGQVTICRGQKIDADRAADQAVPVNSRSAATISAPR